MREQALKARAQLGRELAALRCRVAALETEQARLLARYAADLESENARLRSGSGATGTTAPDTAVERLSAPYIGRALVAVENHLAEMERWAALGNDVAASQSKVAAATRACQALRRICDDQGFVEVLMFMQSHAEKHPADVAPTLSDPTGRFKEQEVEILQLAGLTRLLAQQHVDAAMDAYNTDSGGAMERVQNPMLFLTDLRKLRDASCLTADLLSQGLQQQQSRQRWKKILTFGLGGTAIVVANGVGTALLGPGGVAASGAIGSAAVGVAVELVS